MHSASRPPSFPKGAFQHDKTFCTPQNANKISKRILAAPPDLCYLLTEQQQYDAEAVAPRDEALEKQLFGEEGDGNMGINFTK